MTPDTNGWSEYQRLVINELTRLGNNQNAILRDIGEMRAELSGLKVKAGVWGLLGGVLASLPAVLYLLVKLIDS